MVSKLLFSISGIFLNVFFWFVCSLLGKWASIFVMSFIAIIGTVTLFGTKQATVKVVAESLAVGQPWRARSAVKFSSILVGVGVVCGSVFLIIFGGGDWIGKSLFTSSIGDLTVLLCLWLLVSNFQTLIGEVFRGVKQLRWASLFGDQGTITRILLVLSMFIAWSISMESSLYQIILLAVISNAVTLFLSILFLRPSLKLLDQKKGDIFPVDMFSYILPLWINSISLLIINQVDTIFLGVLRPESEIAIYGIAIRLAQIISTPQLIMNSILPPFVASLYATGQKNNLERLLRTTSTISTFFALVIVLLFGLFGKTILNHLFGEYYIQAYVLTLILALGQVINVATGSCGVLLSMSGFHTQFTRIVIFTGGVGVILLYFLTLYWGVYGTVVAVSVNMIFFMLTTMYYSWRRTGVRSWPFRYLIIPVFLEHE